MTKLKIMTIFILLGLTSLHANANQSNFSSNIEPQIHTYSMKNLSNVLLSGGMVKQPIIAEKNNLEPRTIVNIDLEKISFALDSKGMKDIKDCEIHLSDEKFNFVSVDNYRTLVARINTLLTKNSVSSKPPKDQCFELLQFIFR